MPLIRSARDRHAQVFGVFTEIDVRATLRQKLDVDMEEYVTLGACNPPLASGRWMPIATSVCCCRAMWWCGPMGRMPPWSRRLIRTCESMFLHVRN